MNDPIEVRIFGQNFEISSSRLSNEELRSLAQFLDTRMKQTFTSTNLSSALKVAILTALNLAEEIRSKDDASHCEFDDETQQILQVSRKLDSLSDSIEEFLNE